MLIFWQTDYVLSSDDHDEWLVQHGFPNPRVGPPINPNPGGPEAVLDNPAVPPPAPGNQDQGLPGHVPPLAPEDEAVSIYISFSQVIALSLSGDIVH